MTSGGIVTSTLCVGIKVFSGVPAFGSNGFSLKFSANPVSISSRTVTALSLGSPSVPNLTFVTSSIALR